MDEVKQAGTPYNQILLYISYVLVTMFNSYECVTVKNPTVS